MLPARKERILYISGRHRKDAGARTRVHDCMEAGGRATPGAKTESI